MKKGQIMEGVVSSVRFPNEGTVVTEDGTSVLVKNTLPGQRIRFCIQKCRRGKAQGRLLSVISPSPIETDPACPHFGQCGGCAYQSLPYERQLAMKEQEVQQLLAPYLSKGVFGGIEPSPQVFGYRNKMEFSFGDEQKDGPLSLGLHRRDSFYDIVPVTDCQIVDEDFRQILSVTLSYFREKKTLFLHKNTHVGYLRHLLVRKGAQTGQILVDLVTTSQTNVLPEAPEQPAEAAPQSGTAQKAETKLLEGYKDVLLSLPLDGTIVSILHTTCDSLADVIADEGTQVLFGTDFFEEEILGLRFRIRPFSFFQNNSLAAEVLYTIARDFLLQGESERLCGSLVYDLYCGTGTITQILSPVCQKVIGVEIVPEAVQDARENAEANGLRNCCFLQGDVLKVLDEIGERPDAIVLDPPREGIVPKALDKIIRFGAERIVYISCKPTSLSRDLSAFSAGGYRLEKVKCADLFPGTVHVETVCLLLRSESAGEYHSLTAGPSLRT